MEHARHGGEPPRVAAAAASLERISAAVRDARADRAADAPPTTSAQFLIALRLLRELRTQIAGWEIGRAHV